MSCDYESIHELGFNFYCRKGKNHVRFNKRKVPANEGKYALGKYMIFQAMKNSKEV